MGALNDLLWIERWPVAAAAAFGLALIGTPVARWVALKAGLSNHPTSDRLHRRPTPYLGGVAIMLGALAAGLGLGRTGREVAGILLGAAALGFVGLVDDWRTVDHRVRAGLEVLAALAMYSLGLKAQVTGFAPIDLLITVVWVVGITNAFNLLDNMDGLAAGTAGICAGMLFVISAAGGHYLVAALAAAVFGACLGFLPYNLHPARIFMGDAGSLFLGFVLAALALKVQPAAPRPLSFAVVVLVMGLPIFDTVLVVASRIAHGRSPFQGGLDHTSHRLLRLGLGHGQAVIACYLLAAASGAVALGISRASVAQALPVLVVVGILTVGLARVLWRVPVYEPPAPRRRRTKVHVHERIVPKFLGLAVKWWKRAGWAFGILGAWALITVAPALDGSNAMQSGRDALIAGEQAMARGESVEAVSAFKRAESAFVRAHERMDLPSVRVSAAFPLLGNSLDVAHALADAGARLAVAGGSLARQADVLTKGIGLQAGSIDLNATRSVVPVLEVAAARVAEVGKLIAASPSSGLVGAVSRARAVALEEVERAERMTRGVVDLAGALPRLLGEDQPRRYFLAVQNLAEARATGGFIGSYGILEASGGKLKLVNLGLISDLGLGVFPGVAGPNPEFQSMYGRFGGAAFWRNINMSPDFPTVATSIERLYPVAVPGGRVDGVVAVDSVGLAELMRLTGPAAVPGVAQPVTSEGVVDFTLSTSYALFPDRAVRQEILSGVAADVWGKLAKTNADMRALAGAFGPAVSGGHLKFHQSDPQAQDALVRLGVAGELTQVGPLVAGVRLRDSAGGVAISTASGSAVTLAASAAGAASTGSGSGPATSSGSWAGSAESGVIEASDAVLLVTQNAGANKMDYYLRRELDYRVRLRSDGSSASTASVVLRNTGPVDGLPSEVAGGPPFVSVPGEEHAFASLYVPASTQVVRFASGKDTEIESHIEGSRAVYSRFVRIAPQGSGSLSFDMKAERAAWVSSNGGTYRLAVERQPTAVPDHVRLEITAPEGMRIVAAEGFRVTGGGTTAVFDGDLSAKRVFEVRYARPLASRVLNRLVGWFGPRARD